jgi:hypothetical protein
VCWYVAYPLSLRDLEKMMTERGVSICHAPKGTQKFLSCFGPLRQHFALKRHLLRASLFRKQLAARFVAWRDFGSCRTGELRVR